MPTTRPQQALLTRHHHQPCASALDILDCTLVQQCWQLQRRIANILMSMPCSHDPMPLHLAHVLLCFFYLCPCCHSVSQQTVVHAQAGVRTQNGSTLHTTRHLQFSCKLANSFGNPAFAMRIMPFKHRPQAHPTHCSKSAYARVCTALHIHLLRGSITALHLAVPAPPPTPATTQLMCAIISHAAANPAMHCNTTFRPVRHTTPLCVAGPNPTCQLPGGVPTTWPGGRRAPGQPQPHALQPWPGAPGAPAQVC